MTVHALHEAPGPPLADALAEFERQFVYPLGPARSFRIEHGRDYPRFYRAIGDGRCFVCEENRRVRGVVSVAIRPVLLADGRPVPAAYIGDVKVAPGPRRGTVLLRTAGAAQTWCRARAMAAFGVVMDGTPILPSAYTGRLGIPPFAPVGKLIVLRLKCMGALSADGDFSPATEPEGRECLHRLAKGRLLCPPGSSAERSEISPTWFVRGDGLACGCLEDTRRAKRLVADDGVEMVSAHVSGFAYRDVAAGAALLRHVLGRAAALGFPALFVAVAASEAKGLRAALGDVETVQAPATVFAYGIEPGPLWIVNSAEI
jgi:hypothetical protein